MVKEVMSDGKKYFQCEECLLYYEDKNIVEECEKHCREKKACNLDLIKYAVELNEKKVNCDDCN